MKKGISHVKLTIKTNSHFVGFIDLEYYIVVRSACEVLH